MAKDKGGHGSEKRGGGDYAPSASGKPGYNPKVQGGLRMFGRQPTAAEAAANSANVKAFSAFAGAQRGGSAAGDIANRLGLRPEVAGAVTRAVESGAHTQGVQAVGQPAPAPKFGLNSYTHEIVSPTGDVTARMRLGKNNGIAVDEGKGGGISRNSGTALHDAVAMADYRAHIGSSPSFPADRIGGELHYMTGNEFAGHTVRRVKG